MPDTILVTGASGLLGANFMLTARQRSANVIALYQSCPLKLPGVKSIKIDLTDSSIVRELIRDCKPDWIFHSAALTNVDWCETHFEETWRVNVDVTRHLACSARDVGAGLVYISSDSIFNGEVGHFLEESSPGPLNMYAKSKLAGERVVQDESDRSLIVRTNIYGWNLQEKLSLGEWILSLLESCQEVPGFCDVVFSPILVNDLSEVILDMLEHQLNGLYHVAGSESCSKYEFAMQLSDVFKLDKRLVQPTCIADIHLMALRPKNTSLQTKKVSKELGKPMPGVESGLLRFKALRDSGYVRQLKLMKGV